MKLFTLAVATLLALGNVAVRAQQSNVVQNINIQLFGIRQGRTVTNGNLITKMVDVVRVDTRRVIQELGTATGQAFLPFARLVMVTPLGGGTPAVQVRSGDSKVDVTDLFVLQPLSEAVESIEQNQRRGITLQSDYFVQRIALQDNGAFAPLGLHFDVSGFATQTSVTGRNGQSNMGLDVEVSGSGDRNGNLLILQGSIGVFGNTLEPADSGVGDSN